jgi:hypothetical protein
LKEGSTLKKSILIATLASALCLISTNAIAAGGHGGGHSSFKKGVGKTSCKATVITRTKPEHLASVSPKSEISFWVKGIGIEEAETVEVTAKKIPVKLTVEEKAPFLAFKGNLPDSLVGTAARIQISVHYKKCPAEKGWLLKITE